MTANTSTSMLTGASSTAMGMEMGMGMVFNNDNTAVQVFSSAFSPKTTGQYVGTWFFCFFLAFLWRALIMVLFKLDERWVAKYTRVAHENPDLGSKDSTTLAAVDTWRLSVNLPRALLTSTIQGLAYLCMIIVMILNVGLFFAVLVGYFVGEISFSRVSVHTAGCYDGLKIDMYEGKGHQRQD